MYVEEFMKASDPLILRPYTTLECLFSGAGVIFISIYTYTKILCIVNHHRGPFCRGEKGYFQRWVVRAVRSFSYAHSLPVGLEPTMKRRVKYFAPTNSLLSGVSSRMCRGFHPRCTLPHRHGYSRLRYVPKKEGGRGGEEVGVESD